MVSTRAPLLGALASGLAGLALSLAGVAKLVHPGEFGPYLRDAFLFPQELASVSAFLVAGIEVLSGTALICIAVARASGRAARGVCWAALVLVLVFLADASLRIDEGPACGCFGALLKATRAARIGYSGLVAVLLGVALLVSMGVDWEVRRDQGE